MSENRIATRLRRLLFPLCAFSFLFASTTLLQADSAPFDLDGPTLQARVRRGDKILSIGGVPALQAGDRIWVHADFPSDQSQHYLMIVAFLQGPTNPPPENWFIAIETWKKEVREEGAWVTVPQNAQQALVFLAPDTGGAFGTVRATVRGKPGAFVRAAQDLEQADLGRTRINKFLEEIKDGSPSSPEELHKRVTLLSLALAVKADPECFDKPVDQQSSCLTQDTDHLQLEDAQTQSLIATLTSGPSADLVGSLSTAPVARGGYYSPYVGSVIDLVKLFNTFHSPELQYLPALTAPQQDDMKLKLNSPPSFQKPQSVIVVALPKVAPAVLPPLRAVDPKQVFCLQGASLVLPVKGAPLVFSTEMGREFVLHLQNKSGSAVDLPATPDPARDGFTVDTKELSAARLDSEMTGTLHGYWGFQAYAGPSFQLRSAQSAQWTLSSADSQGLVAGHKETVHLLSGCATCVEQVSAQGTDGKDLKPEWKAVKPDELEITLPLKDESAGTVKLSVKQFGITSPDVVTLHVYPEPAHLDSFRIHAGDKQGVLTGTHLEEIDGFELKGIAFVPAKLSQLEHGETLELETSADVAALHPEESLEAHVKLKDGRDLKLETTVEAARPRVTLVSKSVRRGSDKSTLRLGNANELPQNGELSFLLKASIPEKFAHSEEIEVATADESASTTLSFSNGHLVLQDSEAVLAILDPLKNLGSAAFGPLQFRPVDAAAGKGDWQPLITLVRTPTLADVHCPDDPVKSCTLSGTDLFLLDSVASDPQFKDAVPVPIGYADSTLRVPRPRGTLLYLKLRDDPSTVNTVSLPVLPEDD